MRPFIGEIFSQNVQRDDQQSFWNQKRQNIFHSSDYKKNEREISWFELLILIIEKPLASYIFISAGLCFLMYRFSPLWHDIFKLFCYGFCKNI